MSEDQLTAIASLAYDGRYGTHWEGCETVHPRCAVLKLVDEVRRLRAELDAIRARVHDAYLRTPDVEHPATGDQLIDRLRGIYTVPVNDGAGPLNGSMEFTRRFPTLPINVEAAHEIVRLRECLARANSNMEEVERSLYLKLQDAECERDRLRAELSRYTDSPGRCDQNRHMADAAVSALRFPDREEVSPSDIREAVSRLRVTIAAFRDLAQDLADNWDCDSDSHKYGTRCRKCAAILVLQAAGDTP